MRLTCHRARSVLALFVWLAATGARAVLPREVERAFLEEHIPLSAVSAYVQEIGQARPLVSHQPGKPMNPASTMKLVTTFAGLELLGPDYRWKTEAYAAGAIVDGALEGDLVLKGYGDPKITIEQFQALVAALRATGLTAIRGDLVLDRSYFALPAHDPAAFDAEPLKPYNVGPDALLVNFKSVRFVFSPNAAGDATEIRMEPPLGAVGLHAAPRLVAGECSDWRGALAASFANRADHAEASFGAATRPAAASATGMSPCSTIRITCTPCSRAIGAMPAAPSPASCAKAGHRPERRRWRRCNRLRSTMRCATSTSCPTT